ncbi:MAG: sugar phosphate isomerase/epimerase family protein [Candidatus Thorarchaeota archaeon]
MFLWDSEVDKLCLQLPKIGIDALDVWFDSPSLYLADEKTAKAKLEAISQTEIMKVSHVASHDLNPCSYSKEVRDLTYQLVQRSILYASAMGAQLVTLHGGHNSFGKSCSQYDKDLFLAFLEKLIDWNPTDVVLTIENSPPVHSKLLNSPKVVYQVLEELKEVRLTFDYAHAFSTTSSAWEELLNQYHDRLAIIHLSNPSQEHHRIDFDDHFSKFLSWLKETVPKIIFILEYEQDHLTADPLDVLEEDARKLRNKWRATETKSE